MIQTAKCLVMMTKEGSTKIVNCMTPGIGVLVLRCDHISYIVRIHYYIKIIFPTPRHRSDKQRVK